jgi:hypothetical protein
MMTFKSIPDLEQIRNDPVHASLHDTVKKLVAMFAGQTDYRPEDDGYLVLVEPGDLDRVLDDLDMPWRLSEVPFEGVTVIDGHFHAVFIPNNQFALSFLIPDESWLPGEVRRHLEAHLDP